MGVWGELVADMRGQCLRCGGRSHVDDEICLRDGGVRDAGKYAQTRQRAGERQD
jgi:hypothetical protein